MLNEDQVSAIVVVYKDSADDADREDSIKVLAGEFNVTQMEIRQTLQAAKVYVDKIGKTEKEQYAAALYAVTLIPAKEWMKLTAKSQKALMAIFRRDNVNNDL